MNRWRNKWIKKCMTYKASIEQVISLGRPWQDLGRKGWMNTAWIGDEFGSQVYVGRTVVGKDHRTGKAQNRCQQKSRAFDCMVEWKRPSVEHYLWCRITLIALGTRIWLALCSHFSLERSFAFLSDPCETVKLSSCPFRSLSALKMGHTCVCLRSPVGSPLFRGVWKVLWR